MLRSPIALAAYIKTLTLCLLALPTLLLSTLTFADEARTLHWGELIPEEHRQSTINFVRAQRTPTMHKRKAPQATHGMFLETVAELAEQDVKIAGYMVPLEGGEQGITELLLAPYPGACIHAPPPPPNQLIYVKVSEPIAWEHYYDPIWVEGTLTIETITGETAQSGYKIGQATAKLYERE